MNTEFNKVLAAKSDGQPRADFRPDERIAESAATNARRAKVGRDIL